MSIALIYDVMDDEARADVNSILEGVTSVGATLEGLGHRVEPICVSHGLLPFLQHVERQQPDVVFNLCEGFRGRSAGEYCVAGLLELLNTPYTGSGPVTLSLALDKTLTKRLLATADIPTPEFWVYAPAAVATPPTRYPVILKLAAEDASLGMTRDNLVTDEAGFCKRLLELFDEFEAPVMAETFIDGREFTVAMFNGQPIAFEEIEFTVEPRIICYAAKWHSGSSEFAGTRPQFAPKVASEARATILGLASRVHDLLGMRDYGRVDFRLDPQGRAFVLEANPNPDITPGSGFCLALDAAGISYSSFIARLVDNAIGRSAGRPRHANAPRE